MCTIIVFYFVQLLLALALLDALHPLGPALTRLATATRGDSIKNKINCQ